MPVIHSRLWVFGVGAALIAGCGGDRSTSGGGGENNSTTVTVTFGGTSMPVAVAAQIGTGPLAVQTLSSRTLSLSIPSGTSNYAVADLCPALVTGQSSSQVEYVTEASITDGASLNLYCPYQQSQGGTLTGSLNATAIQGVQFFEINSRNGDSLTQDGAGGGPTVNFDLPAPVGNDRVLVLAFNNQNPGGPVAAKNFDNQTVPGALNGGNTVVFGAADETTPEAITYTNVPSGFSNPSTNIWLAMGDAVEVVQFAGPATTQYAVLPPSATESGDIYFFYAGAHATVGSSSAVYAGVTSSGGPVSFTFPAPWSYAGPKPASLPSFTIGYTEFSGETNVAQEAMIQWESGSGTGSTATNQIELEGTANYQSGSTTLAVPDLSGVAGFLAAPASGTQVQWSASIMQQSYALTNRTPLNATWSSVTNSGSYTVP